MKTIKLAAMLLAAMLLCSCGGAEKTATITTSSEPVRTTESTATATATQTAETTAVATAPASGYTLNGLDLAAYTILYKGASSPAKALAEGIASTTGVTLSVREDVGQADGAYLRVGNYTGVVHYGVAHCKLTAVDTEITLDGATATVLSFGVKNFLAEYVNGDKSLEVEGVTGLYHFTDAHYATGYRQVSETASELAPGITYVKKLYRTKSNMEARVYLAVIAAERVGGIVASSPELGKTLDVPTQYKNAEGTGADVKLAINAGFFKLNTTDTTQKNKPWGLCITDGSVLGEPLSSGNYNVWFGITKEGKAVIGDYKTYTESYRGRLTQAVSGSHIIIKNGMVQSLSAQKTPDPRTIAAICRDGSVVFLCVDGRTSASDGATFADAVQMLLDTGLDIVDAIGLDGGGSTTFVIEGQNGVPSVQNVPSDGKPRAIQSALLVTVE